MCIIEIAYGYFKYTSKCTFYYKMFVFQTFYSNFTEEIDGIGTYPDSITWR